MYTNKQLNTAAARKATLDTLKKMADANHKQTVIDHIESGGLEVRAALRSIAADLKPSFYLEIGVGLGWSMAQVLDEQASCKCTGIDLWVKNYAGWQLDSHDVADDLFKFGAPLFMPGDSREKLPQVEGTFDLILVDGGHSDTVARFDLDESAKLLNPGGVLVFDDLVPSNEGGKFTMIEVWEAFKAEHPDWEFGEFYDALTPFGVGIKPQATKKVEAATQSEEKSAATSSISTKKKPTRRKSS